MGTKRIWMVLLAMQGLALLLVCGCSSLHAGVSVGHYYPVSTDFSGGKMYGLEVDAKLNDKWGAGVELHQLKDFGGSDYTFIRTYEGPFGGSSAPAASAISMVSKLANVQYYLKENLIISAAAGKTETLIQEEGSWYSYSALPGDKSPDGMLYRLSLLYTIKDALSEVTPYVEG